MADLISNDFPGEGQSKLPTGLNILTILTIIGSILFGLIGSIYAFASAKSSYERTKEALESGKMDNAPGWTKNFVNPEMLALQHKMLENRLPILILTIVASILCLWGAFEMRKRKKQGYTFWLIGELLPIPVTIIFLGIGAFKGLGLFGLFIPLIFIILYTVNKKDLIY